MKVFTCTDHKGVWPTGVATVVVAETAGQATDMLVHELAQRGLESAFTLHELDLDVAAVHVLCDGDY